MRQIPFDQSWPSDVQEIYRNDQREVWDATLEPQTYRLYQNQLALYLGLADRYEARSALDVGCAQGTLALLLAESGRSVTGVDIRASFLSYARARHERGDVRFVQANIMDRPSLGQFDIVFANQIVEHLVYPVEFIKALALYVKPGGILVLTTPNHQYVRCGLPSYDELGDPAPYESLQFSAGGADHFFAYTDLELARSVLSAGLRVEERFFFESPWISGHMKMRWIQGLFPTALLGAADRMTLAVAGRRLGHHLAIVGRKEGSVGLSEDGRD